MVITLKYGDGTVYSWTCAHANDINTLVAALAENAKPGWSCIEIIITKLGPNLESSR
jgi:hypothetical protein